MELGIRLAWEIVNDARLAPKLESLVMWNQEILESRKKLNDMIYTTVRGSLHPAGSLRMGAENDPLAVTSQFGLVHGSDNLTVADASIMPRITSVPTNLTCMAIGERLAEHLVQ